MNREEKAAVVDQIAGELGDSDAVFALDYRGITVAQIAELREKLRVSDTKLRVAKNSLSERAADQAGIADLKSLLVGPTALALVKGDAAAAAKVLSDTARVLRGPLTFKGGLMGGALLSAGEIESIARLPSREVLTAQLVGTIASPLSGLARTLNALIQGVAIQLGQIRDQGLVSGTGSADFPAADVSSPDANDSASDASAAVESTQADAASAPEASAEPQAAEAATEPTAADAEAAPSDAAAAESAEAGGASEAESSREAGDASAAESESTAESKTEGTSDDEPNTSDEN